VRIPFTAGPDDDDRRLEAVLRRLLPGQSLGALHKALRKGDIRLAGAKAGPDARVAAGDVIEIWEALVDGGVPDRVPGRPSAPPLPDSWVLWEDDDLLAVLKPSGLVVHRGDGPARPGEAPLDDRVRARLAGTPHGAGASLSFRPGPLHRLDRETSGLVVFSKTLVGARTFSQALADRQVSKTYLAVLAGPLESPREVRERLSRDGGTRTTAVSPEGDEALSLFRPLARAPGLTLVEVDLGTGRTHQIRAHAASLGLPLAGDAKYGGGSPPPGLGVPFLLHAWKLSCGLFPALTAPLSGPQGLWVEKTFKIRL
jgi:RluA family pseudouridine synthase